MKIILGIGNPGKQYESTRHNLGYRCIDKLSSLYHIDVKKKLCQSLTGTGIIGNENVVLAKPQTYVNLTGEATLCLLKKYKLSPDNLIVIHDDLDLPAGRLRIKQGGSSGGHRGIQSIIDILGDKDFIRIKIGISHPELNNGDENRQKDIVDYVLGMLSDEEERLIAPALENACKAIYDIIEVGLVAAMNRYNRRR
jgi:PTH1 family peptidyl-tRNA hydrolase